MGSASEEIRTLSNVKVGIYNEIKALADENCDGRPQRLPTDLTLVEVIERQTKGFTAHQWIVLAPDLRETAPDIVQGDRISAEDLMRLHCAIKASIYATFPQLNERLRENAHIQKLESLLTL